LSNWLNVRELSVFRLSTFVNSTLILA
jgi:hypothetical protein